MAQHPGGDCPLLPLEVFQKTLPRLRLPLVLHLDARDERREPIQFQPVAEAEEQRRQLHRLRADARRRFDDAQGEVQMAAAGDEPRQRLRHPRFHELRPPGPRRRQSRAGQQLRQGRFHRRHPGLEFGDGPGRVQLMAAAAQ